LGFNRKLYDPVQNSSRSVVRSPSFVIQLHNGIAQHQQQILHGVMHLLDHSRIGLSNSDSSMGLVPEKLRIYPENDYFNEENDD
jgi:hypothetical protein